MRLVQLNSDYELVHHLRRTIRYHKVKNRIILIGLIFLCVLFLYIVLDYNFSYIIEFL